MLNNKHTIFANDNIVILPYGYHLKRREKGTYTNILSVSILRDFVCFTMNNGTRMYDTITDKYYSVGHSLIDCCMYRDRMYEIYNDLPPGCIRIDIYDNILKKYVVVNRTPIKISTISLIQELIKEPIIADNIIWPKKIYDRSWPNYTISRINYCDIIFETVE